MNEIANVPLRPDAVISPAGEVAKKFADCLVCEKLRRNGKLAALSEPRTLAAKGCFGCIRCGAVHNKDGTLYVELNAAQQTLVPAEMAALRASNADLMKRLAALEEALGGDVKSSTTAGVESANPQDFAQQLPPPVRQPFATNQSGRGINSDE